MPQRIDLTGQRFGKLVAVEYRSAKNLGAKSGKWLCACDCGQESLVEYGNLKSGNSTSCGCARSESRSTVNSGNIYGRLTVIGRDGSKRHGKSSFAAFLCKCECGVLTKVIGMSLANGDTQSCGCLLSETTRSRAIAMFDDLTGKVFGMLVVACRATTPGYGKNVKWLCVCACGNLTIAPGNSLTSGSKVSCGCAIGSGIPVRDATVRVKASIHTARRRAHRLQATRPFNEELFDLVEREAYSLALMRAEVTGVDWEVDHVVPLQSKLVCGLHNEFNLAVITASENARKRNRYWPNMP